MLDASTKTFLIALSTFVFFAGTAWLDLGTPQAWVKTVRGIAAGVLAIVALLALVGR